MFSNNETIFVPDDLEVSQACSRTTALCFSAHQDDTEFMAFHEIADCFRQPGMWFSACVVTNGAGSPRSGPYESFTDRQMEEVRVREQNKASSIGEYGVQIQLGYPSATVKNGDGDVVRSIAGVIDACGPEIIYTHNLADKHDTHVAVALRVIEAIRLSGHKPGKLYGMEVWRSLDWLNDENKTVFDASAHVNLANALMGVFDSQITGGKRYDAAATGRRAANATFYESHNTDEMEYAIYALDMSCLIEEDASPSEFIALHIDRFKQDVAARIGRLEY